MGLNNSEEKLCHGNFKPDTLGPHMTRSNTWGQRNSIRNCNKGFRSHDWLYVVAVMVIQYYRWKGQISKSESRLSCLYSTTITLPLRNCRLFKMPHFSFLANFGRLHGSIYCILCLLSPIEQNFCLPRSSHTQLAVTRAMYHLRPRITGTCGGDYKQWLYI
jgi:hypothetical protein